MLINDNISHLSIYIMEIKTRKQLKFVIESDYIMNRGYSSPNLAMRLKNLIAPDYIMQYLVAIRMDNYYSNVGKSILLIINKIKLRRLSIKLGFSIGSRVFGYGLVIPHYGTIVVGGTNRLGNYCVLHTSTCISDNGIIIGDSLYLGTGAKLTSKIILGNNVSIAANSVVNKSFNEDNVLLVGAPAFIKAGTKAWYERDGGEYALKVKHVEKLKEKYGLQL